MLHVCVNQHHLLVHAAAPETVSSLLTGSRPVVLEKTMTALPAGHHLKGIIFVFGQAESKNAGPLVLQKIEEASRTLDIVSHIHDKISLVRHEHRALKSAKARLEQMQSEKLFAFTSKIDATSFRILCAVLAHGDVAKACRAMNIKDSTLRKRMARWARCGPAYQILADLVRWRKAMGARGTVPLNESITRATATTADFAGLLSDVLDELLSMNDENWEEKAESLASLLRPHVPR